MLEDNKKNVILTIILGTIFILIAFLTIIPNSIIGKYGFFYTDFVHDMIHFLTGVILLYIAFKKNHWIPKTLRISGMFYIALAIIGAISIGAVSIGKVMGFIGMSGADNILHLVLGLILVFLGTKEISMPDTEENMENI